MTLHYSLKHNVNLRIRNISSLSTICTFGLILGTPILYLITCTRIFNEAVIWGVSFSIMSLSIFYKMICSDKYTQNYLTLYGLSISCTLLSRISFALPLYALCIYLFFLIYKQRIEWLKKWTILGITAGAGGIFQLFYNYMRFGNIFETYPNHLHYHETVRKYSYFNIKRIYDGLTTTLLPTYDNFSTDFPYIIQNTHNYKFNYLFITWKEPYTAITLSSIFFTLIVCCFICKLFHNIFTKQYSTYNKKNLYVYSITIFFLSLECLLVCSCHFMTERYLTEFVPLIFFSTCIFIHKEKNIF